MRKLIGFLAVFLLCVFGLLLLSNKSDDISQGLGHVLTGVSEKIENRDVEELSDSFNGRYNYYYSNLDEELKRAYSVIYNAYYSYNESFTVNLDPKTYNTVNNAVLYDNPEIFWVEPVYSYKDFTDYIIVTPTYRNSQDSIQTIKAQVDNKVNEIYEMAKSYPSDYEKELFIHDYICKIAEYDQSTYDTVGDTAYSALINGKTICEGYCRAFKMVLDKCGIKNYMVTGTGHTSDGSEGHMWSVVNIDAENYYVDVTWDDGDESLLNTTHLYFNMNQSEISKEHTDILPADNKCNGIVSNYFHKSGLFITNLDLTNDSFIKSCAAELDKNGVIEMRFSDAGTYNDFMNKITISDNSLFNCLDLINQQSQRHVNTKKVHYIHNDYYLYVCLIFDEVN